MADLEFFQCEPLRARLSTAGCARMWHSAQRAGAAVHADTSRAACVGCRMGARHAGVDVEMADRTARAVELSATCARCGAVGRRMVHHVHCVSCYNRLREARIGHDRRGRAPKFAAILHPVSLVVAGAGGGERVACYQRCTSRPEAILLAAHQTQGQAISVGFRRLAPLPEGAMIEMAPAFVEILWKPRMRRQRSLLRQAVSRHSPPTITLPPLQLNLFHA